LEAIEKLIGTIQLPREMLDALAEQKAKADELRSPKACDRKEAAN